MNFKAPGRPHDIQKVATLSGGLPLDNGVPIQVNKNAKSYAVASRRCTMHLRFHGRLMAWRCDKLQRYGTTRYHTWRRTFHAHDAGNQSKHVSQPWNVCGKMTGIMCVKHSTTRVREGVSALVVGYSLPRHTARAWSYGAAVRARESLYPRTRVLCAVCRSTAAYARALAAREILPCRSRVHALVVSRDSPGRGRAPASCSEDVPQAEAAGGRT